MQPALLTADVLLLCVASGQAVDSAKALGVSTACTTACPGNSTQQCGGPLALSLYALQKAPWQPLDDSSSSPKALVGAPPAELRSGSPSVVVSRGIAGLATLLAAAWLL
jgi:hypothetical protein